MQPENDNQSRKCRKGSIKKILLWTFVFLFLFFLIPFFAIPAYISSSSGKNLILSKVNSSINGKVEVDSLSMSWFTGVKAGKLNYTDNAGTTKVTAEQVAARPSYFALIGGRVVIDEAKIDKPDVSINLTQKPQQETGQVVPAVIEKPPKTPAEHEVSSSAMPLDRIDLTINEGNFKISAQDANQNIQTLEMRDINSKIALRPLGSKSSFDVSMTIAGANEVSDIAASGQIKTAQKEWSLENATGELSVDINGLELSTFAPLLSFIDSNASASGKLTANVEAKLQKGQFENLQGAVNAANLDVTGSFLKGDRLQSSRFQSDVQLNTTEKAINISRLTIEADGLTAKAKGTVPKTLRSFEDFMKADSTDQLEAEFDCDVAKTFKQIKTLAHFKQDFDINYGRLSGTVNTQAENGQRTLAGKVKLWALEGKFPIKRIILSRPVEVDTKIVSKNEIITVEKLLFNSSFAKASLNGTTDNMSYTADLDLAKMQSDVGQFIDFNSQLTGTAQLIGKGSLVKRVFASTGSASLDNLTITLSDGSVLSESAAKTSYDFQADLDKKQLDVKQADISSSFGKINITNLTVPLSAESQTPLKFNTNFAVELAQLNSWLAALGKTDANTRYAGFARGDLAFKKTGPVFETSAKQISLENLSVTSPGKEPFTQPNMTIAFNGKFDTERKLYDIPQLNIASPQIKISGSISNSQSGSNVKTQGNIKADYDLASATSIVSPFLPAGFSAAGKRNDTLVFSSIYPKSQPALFKSNLNANTTFGFDTAKYMGLNLGKTDLNVKIVNGVMNITPFTTAVNNGKFNFAGSANFTKTPSMLQTPGRIKMFDQINITKETTEMLLKQVNPIFANVTNVTGTLNFDCEKFAIPLQKGYDKDIAISGTMDINNMHLFSSSLLPQITQITGISSNPTITVLPTKFVLADGVLSYDNMQMNFDKTPVIFSGRIGLDKSMKMNVTLPWQRNGQNVVLPLKGTVDKPEIDIGKLAEDQLKQEIQNQLQKGLEKIFK